jgi:hypothetical protein
MPSYLYVCPACGPYESQLSADALQCRCGRTAKRRWHVNFDRTSAKVNGRWDPVVGQYVRNEREFQDALSAARELQSETLGMESQLVSVDARDTSALDELHGRTSAQREEDLEGTRKAQFEAAR